MIESPNPVAIMEILHFVQDGDGVVQDDGRCVQDDGRCTPADCYLVQDDYHWLGKEE